MNGMYSSESSSSSSSSSPLRLVDTPEIIWQHIAAFLPVQDILSFLSTCRSLHTSCSQSDVFWTRMLREQFGTLSSSSPCESPLLSCQHVLHSVSGNGGGGVLGAATGLRRHAGGVGAAADPRELYLVQAHADQLVRARWIAVQPNNPWPTDREGHLCTRIGNYIVLTGGFTEDSNVYLKEIVPTAAPCATSLLSWSLSLNHRLQPFDTGYQQWKRIQPTIVESPIPVLATAYTADTVHLPLQQHPQPQRIETRPCTVYGASFTTLDAHRAVRFGGFRSGGYSNETNQVVLLTLHDNSNNDNNFHNSNAPTITWKVIHCTRQSGGSIGDIHWVTRSARGYHSATLLYDRYLVIIGGMQSSASAWEPIVLDTLTWTWLDDCVGVVTTTPGSSNTTATSTSAHDASSSSSTRRRDRPWMDDDSSENQHPSPRHGHTVIVDQARKRLVLFGGGSGSDLLRSGQDNTEVWEYRLPEHITELVPSLVDGWRLLHEDQHPSLGDHDLEDDDDDEDNSGGNGNYMLLPNSRRNDPNRLSAAEALTLGRCHVSFLVSRDKVLLVFGSGRPSTNRILGYQLSTDSFFRIPVTGSIPRPRFTFAAVYLEEYGYLFVHGGYSSQFGESLDDANVLDLAASLNREFSIFVPNPQMRTCRLVTNEEAIEEAAADGWRIAMEGFLAPVNATAHTRALLEFMASLRLRAHGLESAESDLDDVDDAMMD